MLVGLKHIIFKKLTRFSNIHRNGMGETPQNFHESNLGTCENDANPGATDSFISLKSITIMNKKTIKNGLGNYVSPMICVVPFVAEGVMCQSPASIYGEEGAAGLTIEDEENYGTF